MTDVLVLAVAAATGVAVGVVYFGGLWLTVRRLPTARRPALLTLASFLARAAAAGLGFVVLPGDGPLRLLVALAAVLAVRSTLVRRLGPAPTSSPMPVGGGGAR